MAFVIPTIPQMGRPGVAEWVFFGIESASDQWSRLLGMKMASNFEYEDFRALSDMNYATQLSEGSSIEIQTVYSPQNVQVYPINRAIGFEISRQAKKVSLETKVKAPLKQMGVVMAETKNLVVANIFALGHTDPQSSGTITMDDEALFDSDHPIANGTSTASNVGALALSAANLETAVTALRRQVTESGKPKVNAGGMFLVVPPSLWLVARRIVESTQQAQTANNDKNVVGDGIEVVVMDYITASAMQDNWWLVMKNPAKNPLSMITRMPMDTDEDYDKRTLTHFYSAYEEYEVFAKDWRGTYGSSP